MTNKSEQFREILIKRLTLRNNDLSVLIDNAFTNYKNHLNIKGKAEVEANQEWYKTLSVDSAMNSWFREATEDLRGNEQFVDSLIDPVIQKIIRENRGSVLQGMEGIIKDLALVKSGPGSELTVTEYEELGPAMEKLSAHLTGAIQQVVDSLGDFGKAIKQNEKARVEVPSSSPNNSNKSQKTDTKIKE